MSAQPIGLEPSAADPAEAVCDPDTTPAPTIRDLVRQLLAGHEGVTVEDAVLVVDELVSNARQHGHAPRTCRLSLINQGRRLRVEVEDAAPEQPSIRTPDPTGGRGLLMVDRLATAWGVRPYHGYKTVWAELELGRRGQQGRARHLSLALD